MTSITSIQMRKLADKIRKYNTMAEGQDKYAKFALLATWCEGCSNILELEESVNVFEQDKKDMLITETLNRN